MQCSGTTPEPERDMSDKLPFIQSKSCGPTTSDIRWITKRKFSEEDNYPIQG